MRTGPASMDVPVVVIDARMVTNVPHGIAKYVTLLAKGLSQLAEKGSLPYRPIFLVSQESIAWAPFETRIVSTPFLDPRELLALPKILQDLKADLYHSPSFSSLWSCPCPHVVTIHDLNHLTFGSFSKKIYYRTLLKRFARTAKEILTVSQFSKAEIAHWLGISPGKIQVVYNAIEPVEPEVSNPRDLDLDFEVLTRGKYFFSLGTSKPHKNLKTLIRGYQLYASRNSKPWPLVVTLNLDELKELAMIDSTPEVLGGLQPALPLGIKALGKISESRAVSLLSQAGGLFAPSLYEGFGLPPVEAAAAGISVAASDIPPHREGLERLDNFGVTWVKPSDEEGWSRAFEDIQGGLIPKPSFDQQVKVLSQFSVHRLGSTMDQIYRATLGLPKS